MDVKEALKYFKGQTNEMQFISGGIRCGKSYRQEAYKAAIEALEKVPVLEAENARLREKETPKESLKKDLSHYDEGSLCIHFESYCPVCKHLVESGYDYCGFCGQAIKIDKE